MPVYALGDKIPQIADDAFIAPGAQVIGDVVIGAGTSLWFNVVVRGDDHSIRIGERTNIQDGTVVHISKDTHPTTIGSDILIGHMALLHGCTLEDGCFVGMHSTVMDGCVVEKNAFLAAGSLLTPGKRVPTGQMWGGRPARYIRDLSPEELELLKSGPQHYAELAQQYRTDLKLISE